MGRAIDVIGNGLVLVTLQASVSDDQDLRCLMTSSSHKELISKCPVYPRLLNINGLVQKPQ